MRPHLWQPPVALSHEETAIVRRIHRAKLFVFLREQRHQLFSEAFQEELATTLYANTPKGRPPIPPAQLALATILQAYTGVSDDEVIEATTLDRRWQLVLDCLDCADPPFSKATLIAFRQRLIAREGDRRLVERTLEVAQASAAFSPKALRVALDSSPLWGAGKVEDTDNLLGHALRTALSVIARQQGRGLTDVATEAGVAELVGRPLSLKTALDLDWDDPDARTWGLVRLLAAVTAVEQWLDTQPTAVSAQPTVQASRAAAEQVCTQDVEMTVTGMPALRQGVSRDRRISIEDEQIRHGRKSRSVRVDGYKRHVLHDLDSGLVCAVGVTAANAAEASVTDALDADLKATHLSLDDLAEAHLDRGYLSRRWVRERPASLAIYCKAWPVRNGSYFPKTAFILDWARQRIRCPAQVELPFTPGGIVHFPAATCAVCPLRERCTTSPRGRSVSASTHQRGAPSYASGPPSSTPWRTSATGRADAPAIVASVRTSLTCAAVPSWRIFTS
jgi:Transposase domain (DUF772)